MNKDKYTFKGRYTMRGVNNSYYVYDRELECTTQLLGGTFNKARDELLKFKVEHNDK
jgi:hypothetical protein